VGIAPKRRDPADALLIQTFLAKHGLARLAGIFSPTNQRDQTFRCLTDVSPEPPDKHGLTRWPPGVATTDQGKRYASEYEEARLRYYKPVPGEAAYKAQENIRRDAGVYEDRLSVTESGMSLGDGKNYRLSWDGAKAVPESQKLPKEGKLPERHCQNPECLKEIGEKKHHNIEYCGAKCRERAKELRRRHKVNQASRPILYRNESDVSADLTNDTSQLETGVISPHISRGIVSKDCPAEVAVYQQ